MIQLDAVGEVLGPYVHRYSSRDVVLYHLSIGARAAGFPRPILHGLCTFGFVCRAVVARACGGDPGRLREMGVRFTAPVFPGDTITTRGWRMGPGTYHLGVSTELGPVLDNAYALVDEG